MYALYKQLHPPTGVEYSVCCNFFDHSEKNLVTAGVNQIQVYRLCSEVEPFAKSAEKDGATSSESKVKKQKLECVASYQLFGNVASMQSVSFSGSSRDALLLCFEEAKLSLCEYDPGTRDLKTLSLHYFEDEELRDGCCQKGVRHSEIRVDPEGRCAVMLVYGSQLVVLPFKKDSASDELDATNLSSTSKSPILSSYLIDLRTLDERVTNVVDIQFLHGYYEPTVLILYEPLPTWTGRVAVRRDTCCIVAISLNIMERTHPIIWSLGNLPFDCLKTFPVPKPIGGVIVFAVNTLLYLNQSFPPYGVSLNSLTNFNTEFPLKPQDGVKMTLDCAQAEFISHDKLVISLKGGELYVLTLIVDSMRAVRSFHLDKAAASVLTTCMCLCEENYLFLGSRLGNSLLLRYQEKAKEGEQQVTEQKKDKAEPPAKKRKDDLEDWIASDVSQLDDLDELEVYGSETQQMTTDDVTQYMFEVCDSIMNIGPCGQVEMGEPAFLSEEFSNHADPDLELVTTSGYGKNGAISVLQRNIRPQVVTTFELPGCFDMWTVIGSRDEQSTSTEKLPGSHAYLLLSRSDSTMVLQTGEEIMELDQSSFCTDAPTIFAGNIGDANLIVQVTAKGVRLMEGVHQLQHVALDGTIVACSLADPHLVLLSDEGRLIHLTLQSVQDKTPRLTLHRPSLHTKSKMTLVTAYRDVSNIFVTSKSSVTPAVKTAPETNPSTSAANTSSADNEDDLLYGGDSDIDAITSSWQAPPPKPVETTSTKRKREEEKEIKPTYWAVIVRESGNLEIYSMHDWQLVFLVKNFPVGYRLLVDSMQTSDHQQLTGHKPSGPDRASISEPQEQPPVIHEILLIGLGPKKAKPMLFARVNEDLLFYDAFAFESSSQGHLQIRFRKVSHGLMVQSRAKSSSVPDSSDRKRWLRPFSDISGYSGVFLCGAYPHWIMMTQRGQLRLHPMAIDGSVTCFTAFHNVNCPKGFLYFNAQDELRIAVLPTHLSYDSHWPVRKVPLRCTPHFVVYHPESKTYSVVTSQPEVTKQLVKVAGDGEKEIDTLERDERFIFPAINKFSIQLFSPVSWEAISNTKFELDTWEHVLSIKTVNLKSEGTMSGLKGYIACGTNLNYNEDVSSRGKLIIYDVIDVVPEPGQPLTRNKIKIVYNKEQKGPVTALDSVQGFLVTAIGQKVYIWQLKDNDLAGIAFIDTQIYIHQMAALKNLIIIGDVCKSISVLRYQEDMKVLSLVSRDVRPMEVYSVAYMVDRKNLAFLVSDRMKNIHIYCYEPEVRESYGGQRLIRKADMNLGSHVNAFFRVKCKVTDPSCGVQHSPDLKNKHITYYVSLDGSIGYLLPITEKLYRRLSMLQNALNQQIPHTGGLNPKAYRQCVNEFRQLSNLQKNILDGDLLWKYLSLSLTERSEMAKRIGTSAQQIEEDLLDIDRSTAHF